MGEIIIKHQTTPATPATDRTSIFVDSSTKKLASKDDTGAVHYYEALGDLSASEVANDSSVTGTTVKDALQTLDSTKEPTVTKGNLTAGSTKISIGGTGTNAVIGAGVSVDVSESNITHSNLGGLTTTDAGHTQFPLLTGRAGGQTVSGGTLTTQGLTLRANQADTTTGTVAITTSTSSTNSTSGALTVAGGIGVAGAGNFGSTLAASNLSGTNTGDVTLATDHGLSLSGQVIGMGTPSTLTAATTNAVTTTTHTHAVTGFTTENAAIVAGTNTKITYDTKGLVTAGTAANLDDLGDVSVPTPTVNDILTWNGTSWTNSTPAVGSGNGVIFYLDDGASDIPTYHVLSPFPTGGVEVTDSVSVTSGTSPALIESYATVSSGLGSTQIDGGVWQFNIWALTNNATGTNTVQINVYSRTSGGVETLLFTVSTPDLTTTAALYEIETVQPSFVISATDRLVFKFYGTNSTGVSHIISYYHNGTSRYSHIHTPLIQRHNDLVGLQGGTSSEYYHLTQSQNLDVANATNLNTASTLVKRDASGNFSAGTITAALTGTASGNVTSVSGSAPISSSGGLTPTISISQSGSGTNGYLSSTDWNTFNGKLTPNAAITGATKTKITYDANGLVTSGADATTADIADSTNKRYVTDANLTVIGNTSGTNSGDVSLATNHGLSLTGQVIGMGTPSTVTLATTNSVTTTTHTHALTGVQAALTNPVTGTGVAGQMSYWDGTTTQTGSANQTYDATLGTGGLTLANTTDSTSSVTGSIKTAGGVGIAKALHVGTSVTSKMSTAASLGAELISVSASDRTFAADTGRWTGTGWTIGSGVYTHVAGANAATLNNTALGATTVAGTTYQVVMTVVTTTAGTLTISFGGTSASPVGQKTGTLTAYTANIVAANTNPLTLTPNAAWAGTIDNVSIKAITTSVSALNLKDSAGTIQTEARPVSSSSFGLGLTALQSTTAANNTAVGCNALTKNVAGTNNTAIGFNSLTNNTKAIDCTAVGGSALNMNTTGGNNSAIGANALKNNIYANDCTAVGANALTTNTVGNNNTAVGATAMYANTTGADNTAIGFDAMFSNTTGYNNIAIGSVTMFDQTTGHDNVGIGYNALRFVVSDAYLTAIGTQALESCNGGSENTAVGAFSSLGTTTGDANTSVGSAALFTNSTGGNNTAIGTNALKLSTTSSNNTAVGLQAMYSNTTGADNTALGYNAGYNSGVALQTISTGTFIGSGANSSANAISNVTALGATAQVTKSNQIVLGNTSVVEVLVPSTSAKLGIGITPTSNIHNNGSQAQKVTTATDSVTLSDVHNIVLCNKATAMTVTLPAASTCVDRVYVIKNINVGTVTIDGNASETIDGALTKDLASQWGVYTIACDGANWFII